jgi:asparaginyl-tRNA synthetase
MDVKSLLLYPLINTKTKVKGWVKTKRAGKKVTFITINDGSTAENLQIVSDTDSISNEVMKLIQTGVSLEIEGIIVPSKGGEQNVELQASTITVLGEASADDYPLQPKKHSLEFLRTKAHLRFRTSTFGAIFRIRSAVSHAIHDFFRTRDFYYIHSPIITSVDAEGAGSMFSVTSIDLNRLQTSKNIDINQDFFDQRAYLTVSGQLAAETAIFGLSKVYTFGPTFRAENSNTTRHLAEFWMVEPEMAFYDLDETINLIEIFIKYIINFVLENCKTDLLFLDNNGESKNGHLIQKLKSTLEQSFEVIEYSKAIEILKKTEEKKTVSFVNPVSWGLDLASEHERYLVEKHFKKPVFIKNYPADLKSFYMRLNDDSKTVAAVDLLFPDIGEVIGGSQREERLDYLQNAMNRKNMDINKLDWYLDTRRFGSVIHSGFGLGLERIVQFITGMNNIRDVIPFPRTPGTLHF